MSNMQAMTQQRQAAAPALSKPPRCPICEMYVFGDQAQAAIYQIPYYITVNRAVGALCIGCAGGDDGMERLLAMVATIEGQHDNNKEIPMSKSNGLFLEVETGVLPPAGGLSGGGMSKYTPLEQAVMGLTIDDKTGKGEWARFKFAEPRLATNANAWLGKRSRTVYRERGHDLNRRVVKNEDGTAWLYVQRFKVKDQS